LTPVQSALTRYRVIAWFVGVLLVVLTLVAMPLKYLAHDDTLVAVVGPVHGFAYMVYLALAFHLSVLARWPFRYTILILLAGTVPFLSFVAERSVTRRVRAKLDGPSPLVSAGS
jgi:integral membrane protein